MSHDSALTVHRLSDVDPTKVHLTVPVGFGARDARMTLHYGVVGPDDLDQRRGWSITTPLRTLVDVAGGDLPQEQIDSAVDDALRSGLTTTRRLLRSAADSEDRTALRLERALARSSDG